MKPLLIKQKPHWEHQFPEYVWAYYEEFELFLEEVWKFLNLPEPTLAQRNVAKYLQYSIDEVELININKKQKDILTQTRKQTIVRAFRSLGKSYITSTLVIWKLMRNPRDEKTLVISASGQKAKEFVHQIRSIITSMPLISWLLTGTREKNTMRRDMADRFDVTFSSLAQSFSLKASGITSQITGSRATTIVADDIEVEDNSRTEESRSRLLRAIANDFASIVKTESDKLGDIIFLGTPRHEESIYNTLVKSMGYSCFTIPARMPNENKLNNYNIITDNGNTISMLAPYILKRWEAGEFIPGKSIDKRYTDDSLQLIETQGLTAFTLNYMLDTSISNAERYPLKLRDLMFLQVSNKKAPASLSWGRQNDKKNYINDMPHIGFVGDFYLRPLFIDDQWRDYDESILFVDPAGRGKDETAWVIVRSLNGYLYVVCSNGNVNPELSYLEIAKDAKQYQVHTILVEPNAGQGMWMYAMQPVLQQIYPNQCTVKESEWSRGKKESRIIDTLEPVFLQHRLIISEDIARADIQNSLKYSLLYQITRITREAGCLSHDDRIDALAGAVAYYSKHMTIDTDQAVKIMREEEANIMYEEYMESLLNPWDGDIRHMKSTSGGDVFRCGNF